MTKEYELSDDELRMQELCKGLESLKKQRHNARLGKISADIIIRNLNSLIIETMENIAELQRKGIKRFEVKEEQQNGEPQLQNP